MPDHGSDGVSRRYVLGATSGTAVGVGLVGAASADEGGDDSESDDDCQYYTIAAAGEMHEHGEHGEGEHDDRYRS